MAAPAAPPPADPLAKLGLIPKSGRVEDIDLKALLAVPVVSSSARRKQSLFEAVSEVTVIEGDDIRGMPIDLTAEALRRAPGVFVMQTNANKADVGLRGVNRLLNNYALVLVDGRNIADLALGSVRWGALSFHRGDVERIEILHGPGSTLYGANALSGVINISTKRPLDHIGFESLLTTGAYFVNDANAWASSRTRITNGGSGYLAMNIANKAKTLGLRVSAGFNGLPDWNDLDASAAPVNGNYHFYLRSMAQYWKGPLEILLSLSHTQSEHDELFSVNSAPWPALISQQTLRLSIERKKLFGDVMTIRAQLDARRLSLLTRDRPNATTIRETSPLNYNVHARVEVDLKMFKGRNRLIVGGELTYQDTSGFFGVDPTSTYLGVFAQDDLILLDKPGPRLLISAAIRLEQVRSSGAGLDVTYNNINPRVGVVLNVKNRHSVRLMAATSFKTPSTFENFVTLTAAYPGGAPPVRLVAANPQLRPTEMQSIELGYRARWRHLRLDSTLFIQRVNEYSDLSRELRTPLGYDNVDSFTQVGGRASVDYIGRRARAWIHYMLAKRIGGDIGSDWPEHVGGAGGQIKLPWKLHLRGMVSIWSVLRPSLVTGGARTALDRTTAKISPQAILSLRLSRALLERLSVFVSARNMLALGRDRQRLQQYVRGEPIGASVVVGVDIRGL